MRLYLSSFRTGDHPERPVELVEPGRRAAVIANAMDNAPVEHRNEGVQRELDVIVPHVDSPGHPETERCNALADRFRAEGVPHRTLRDGEAIVNGSRSPG